MTEGMEATLRDAELLKKRVKLPLPNQAVIPRRTLGRCKQEPERVWPPGSQKSAQMFDQLARNWEPTIAAAGLHCL